VAGASALNPAARTPLAFRFAAGTAIKEALVFVADASGISVNFDSSVAESKTTTAINLDNVSLEQALGAILTSNGLFYKVLTPRSVLVVADTPQNRQRYEELLVQTFRLSHADATELSAVLNSMLGGQGPQQSRPQVQANKSANTITIRGTVPAVALAERLIEASDRPQAEVVIDLEFLEIDRSRAKSHGLNLASFQVGLQYSPDGGATPSPSGGSPVDFTTMLAGLSTTYFIGTVPPVVVKFLESDSRTRLLARPSLRGASGTKLTANFGDEVPVPSTTFQPLATGGTAINPVTSFTYRSVGINIEMTAVVTYDDEILVELDVESSTSGRDVNVAGQNLPSFGSRKVRTRLRVRNGESSLLAGLIHDDDRRALAGVSGSIHVPLLSRLFSANERQILNTELVILATPHVVRQRALTPRDLAPVVVRRP